jgi:hypothetical protein
MDDLTPAEVELHPVLRQAQAAVHRNRAVPAFQDALQARL